MAKFLSYKYSCDPSVRTEKTECTGTAQPPPEEESIPEHSPTFRLDQQHLQGKSKQETRTRTCMIFIYLPDSATVLSPSIKEYENSKVHLKMYRKISLHIWNA